jgi:hypothetical protein
MGELHRPDILQCTRARRGVPALRVYFDDKDRVLEASDSIHPGDRFADTMNLRRGPAS